MENGFVLDYGISTFNSECGGDFTLCLPSSHQCGYSQLQLGLNTPDKQFTGTGCCFGCSFIWGFGHGFGRGIIDVIDETATL